MDVRGLGGVREIGADLRDLGLTADGRERREAAEDLTPRANFAALPDIRAPPVVQRQPASPAPPPRPHNQLTRLPNISLTQVPRAAQTGVTISATLLHGPRQPPPHDAGPYREEDVLLSLQLLAYLSKYPHVRQAFYKPRAVFNPAMQVCGMDPPPGPFETLVRGKAKYRPSTSSYATPSASSNPAPTTNYPLPSHAGPALTQSTNIFSLVERFTFRASPAEINLPTTPPSIPAEFQHWAGVVMRNACRKDESRGGIRQCANVQCGKWETFPREFAKCRRCRKAKYCGKDCQSKAWSEGHRFWCSARRRRGPG
ncbi:hypothetical protein M422DRAFT_232923 [Sphaerobolus stellatus SS14]|uniref:MYND-type domain-containing protein n=1 Tax=Sphaerobolus stellatus (strain SS14) TaxID=990650 RepID=A0A0C9UKV7_SPHS4|nr:hypothetical protein M422DRAFT_232923 [Sphaerobolus stellatus SS14]